MMVIGYQEVRHPELLLVPLSPFVMTCPNETVH